ncbi:hypothetical protein MKX03_013274 [Papaver bracteatum]|nr:hypothetical protein MKX03_013274 [Papaver bracteatum]
MNALLGHSPFPQPEQDMNLLRKEAKKDWRNYCCYISQIPHKALLKDALSFYRLMVVWLVDLVGGFEMPLPSSCPIEFACMPEHLVGDAIELLIFVFVCSGLFGDVIPEMDEFIKFIIMFMASPNYIRNPYIRERMVELLSLCLGNRRCASSVITVFKGSELNLEFLVRDLLELYAKSVFTGSPNNIQFRKMINENINLLDSESFMWMQERDRMFQCDKDMIGRRISYRIASLKMLAFTSKQIIVPFLLPHMVDTVVTMLNRFLVHILSLHTKSSFGTRRFMKCGCCLEILLKQIVSIYVHLARIFIELGTRVNDAARKAIETEASLGEIPNDFLDPIVIRLMEDPVILPSTKSVDRAVIQRHLGNYDTDPFSGLLLTQEMLIPNVELKAKIMKFVISKQSQQLK